LLTDVTSAVEPLRATGSNAWDASRALLAKAGGDYAGDYVDATLGESAQLDTLLKRSTVYVRGPIASFAGEATVERAAAESVRDAFIHCLLVPPASRSEQALRPRVAAVYRGEAISADDAARVHRLHDAIGVREFVGESWAAEVNGARSGAELDRLRDRVNEVQLERAVRAAQAELLVYLVDEPKKPGTPSELDGANDHFVRVGIVELDSGKALLRLRKRVDPSWIAKAQRGYLARGLNACRLAIDVREALGEPTGD
jgi:hypothetical protein